MTTLLEGEDLPPAEPKNFYEELVGESKKFRDNEALAKGKWESDNYVKILERRLDSYVEDIKTLREDNTTRAKLEDLVNQMRSNREEQLASSNNTPANEVQKPAINQDEIKSLVSNTVQEMRMTEKQNANFDMVKEKLQQRYGSNYKDAVKHQINDLGITEQELNDMARKSPKLLMKSLGLEEQKSSNPYQAPPRSVSSQTSFAPTASRERTWSYYQEMKQKNPDAWFDRNTAIQMNKDALELGERFMDGDFFKPGLHERT